MMFIPAPDKPSRLQAVVEGFVDGILILTELGGWVHANSTAQRICRQLTDEPSPPNVPKEIWQVCWSLLDSRELFPEQKFVLESEVTTKAGTTLRIRAQWLEPEVDIKPVGQSQSTAALEENRSYLLVILEDRHQSVQNLAACDARKYGLTQRQAQIWSLRQSGYSYHQIATQLYVTLNTVKKHMKDIHAKIQEAQEWQGLR